MMRKFYRHGKAALRVTIDWVKDDMRAMLVDPTLYKADVSQHKVVTDVPTEAIIAISEPLLERSLVIDEGFSKAAEFGQVFKGKVGALIVFKNSGVMSTSQLLTYNDEVKGFPFQANGAETTIGWPDNKVFRT